MPNNSRLLEPDAGLFTLPVEEWHQDLDVRSDPDVLNKAVVEPAGGVFTLPVEAWAIDVFSAKFNENHDAKTGEFSEGSGEGSDPYGGAQEVTEAQWKTSSMKSASLWSDREKTALHEYTDLSFHEINSILRGTSDEYLGGKLSSVDAEAWKQNIADLRAALDKTPTEESLVVSRGVSQHVFDSIVGQGKSFVDRGFASTTIKPANEAAFWKDRAIEIVVPKGTPVAFVGEVSADRHEGEVILPPDAVYTKVSDGVIPVYSVSYVKSGKAAELDLAKYNENHDERGRFTSGDGTSGPYRGAQVPSKDRWLDTSTKSFDTWSERQRAVFSDYCGTGYHEINSALRGVGPDSSMIAALTESDTKAALDSARILMDAMGKTPTEDRMVLTRAVSDATYAIIKASGRSYIDKGFVSASAAGADEHNGWKPRYIEIVVPKGTPAAFVGQVDHVQKGEREVILPSGSRFELVAEARWSPHNTDIYRLVPPKSKKVAEPELDKFNENHDEQGRFSEGSSGGEPKPVGVLESANLAEALQNALTLNERSAVKFYTAEGHREINAALRDPARHGDTSSTGILTLEIKDLRSVIDKAPALDHDILLSRLVSSDTLARMSAPGDFVDAGFLSTTHQYLEPFAKVPLGNMRTPVTIIVPAGTKAAFLDNVSSTNWEKEVLLRDGTHLEHVSERVLRVVPSDPKKTEKSSDHGQGKASVSARAELAQLRNFLKHGKPLSKFVAKTPLVKTAVRRGGDIPWAMHALKVADDKQEIAKKLIDELQQKLADIADSLAQGDIERDEFVSDSKDALAEAYRQAVLAGAQVEFEAYKLSQDDQDSVARYADAQEEYLNGMADDIETGAAQDDGSGGLLGALALLAGTALAMRLGLYASSMYPRYEQGRMSGWKAANPDAVPTITWNSADDPDVCDLCDERDGQQFTEEDLPGFPGDGGFGEICEGGPVCRCWLGYEAADSGDGSDTGDGSDSGDGSDAGDGTDSGGDLGEEDLLAAGAEPDLAKFNENHDEHGRFAAGDASDPYGGAERPSESWWAKQSTDAISIYSDAQEAAVRGYTSSGSLFINSALRNPEDTDADSWKVTISNLQSAAQASVLDHDIVVSRAMSTHTWNNLVEKTYDGRAYKDMGFVSTSVLPPSELNWKPHVVEIVVPKGTPVLFVGSLTHTVLEQEIVLGSGCTFRKVADTGTTKSGFPVYRAEPPKASKAAEAGTVVMSPSGTISYYRAAPSLDKFNENHDEAGRFATGDEGAQHAPRLDRTGWDTRSEEFASRLSPDELAAFKFYTGPGNRGINSLMRGTATEADLAAKYKPAIVESMVNSARLMQNVLDKVPPLDRDIEVVRAVSGRVLAEMDHTPGFVDRGFCSTSFHDVPWKAARIVITVPAGTKVACLGKVTLAPMEGEVLIPQGARFEKVGEKAFRIVSTGNKFGEADLLKFNENHDEHGRFSAGDAQSDHYGGAREISYLELEDWSRTAAQGLTPGQEEAVREYAADSYLPMNWYLRGNGPEGFFSPTQVAYAKSDVERLVGACNSFRAPIDVVLSRGVSDAVFSKLVEGGGYVDKGFVSATVNSPDEMIWKDHHIQIVVPKGTPMLPVGELTGNKGEREVILPPGGRLVRVSTGTGTRYHTDVFRFEHQSGSGADLVKGGEGSGNFSHEGRPGEVGGSGPGGGVSARPMDKSEWMSRSEEFAKHVDPRGERAFYDFTTPKYKLINGYLRGLKPASEVDEYLRTDTVAALDKSIASYTTDRDLLVSRFVSKEALRIVQEGKPFVDRGFTSTTFKQEWEYSHPTHVRIEIVIPKGTHCAPLGVESSYPAEGEVLLPRGSRYVPVGGNVWRLDQENAKAARPYIGKAAVAGGEGDIDRFTWDVGDFEVEDGDGPDLAKYNENHDERGRFAGSGGDAVSDPYRGAQEMSFLGFSKLSDSAASKYSHEQKKLIEDYTGFLYFDLNAVLRGTAPANFRGGDGEAIDQIRAQADALMVAAKLTPTDKPLVVTRSVSEKVFGDIQSGGRKYVDTGFVSTTANQPGVLLFKEREIQVVVPAGTPVLWTGSISIHPAEREVVILPGSTFTRVSDGSNTPYGVPVYRVTPSKSLGEKASEPDLTKFNENHDEHGRFAAGEGSTAVAGTVRQPWEMSSSEWKSVVKGRAGFRGLPESADTSNLFQTQFLEGRHIVEVTSKADRGYGSEYDLRMFSPPISTVKEGTGYYAWDTGKEFPQTRIYDSAVVDKDLNIVDKRYSKEGAIFDPEGTPSKDSIFRGMSSPEFENSMKSGELGSKGDLNFDSQKGKTCYATNPSQAASYAGGFAPWFAMPSFEQPGYVVQVEKPASAVLTRVGEVEVKGSLPISSVEKVYELRVASEDPGDQTLKRDSYGIPAKPGKEPLTEGSSSGMSQQYVVREVPKSEWGYTFHRRQVAQAISEGKSVPSSALAEYPDLKSKKAAEPDLAKFNENHDESGRFSAGDGSPSTSNPYGQATRVSAAEWTSRSEATIKTASHELKRCVENYTGDGYHDINGVLRGTVSYEGMPDYLKQQIPEFVGLLRSAMVPLDRGIVVTRGISTALFNEVVNSSKSYVDKGFVSTSAKPPELLARGEVKIEIVVPKGVPALFVGGMSAVKSEGEVILPPGLRYTRVSGKQQVEVFMASLPKSKAVKMTELTKGGAGSGNFGHEGRPGEVGGSGAGGGGEAAPTVKPYSELSPADRMLTASYHDIKHTMNEQLSRIQAGTPRHVAVGDGPLTHDTTALIMENAAAQVSSYRAYLAGDTMDRLHSYVRILGNDVTAAGPDMPGVKSSDMDKLVQDSVSKIVFQEVESNQVQFTDHGIRHITSDVEMQHQILDVLAAQGLATSPRDRLLGTFLLTSHDIGYTTPYIRAGGPDSIPATKDHPAFSEKITQEQADLWNKDKIFTADEYSRAMGIIRTHDSTSLDTKDPLAFATRVADNMSLFHEEKLPGMFKYVRDGSTSLVKMADALQKGDHATFETERAGLKDRIDKSALDGGLKRDLYAAVRDINPYTPKFSLGTLAGEVSHVGSTSDSLVHVDVAYNATDVMLQRMFDMGQRQTQKMLGDYGVKSYDQTNYRFGDAGAGKAALEIQVHGVPSKATVKTSKLDMVKGSIQKYNEHHDEHGRFAEGDDGGVKFVQSVPDGFKGKYLLTGEDRRIAWARMNSVYEKSPTPEMLTRAVTNVQEICNRYPISCCRTYEGAMGVLADGRFKTQFETHRSGGGLDEEGRVAAESRGLGIPEGAPVGEHPIYAAIAVPGSIHGAYGGVEFVLKDDVKDRSTVTVGDSFGLMYAGRVAPAPVRSVDPASMQWNAPEAAKLNLKSPNVRSVGYLEVQVQGGISVRDVDRIVIDPLKIPVLEKIADLEGAAARAHIPVSYKKEVAGG